MLLSRKDETYAIGKYCIHQTTIPYASGANIPNKIPVKIRSLLITLIPVFFTKNETINAGVPFNNSIQYKKVYGLGEFLTPIPSTRV